MMRGLSAFLAGVLFAAGLVVSGMTQPEKILGFLDVFGMWDPSLLFVMAGGLLVYAGLYRLIMRRTGPLFEAKFFVPTRRDLDIRLLVGAGIFGVGWGLGGYCPGPSLVSLVSGKEAVIFVVCMIIGMYTERLIDSIFGHLRGSV